MLEHDAADTEPLPADNLKGGLDEPFLVAFDEIFVPMVNGRACDNRGFCRYFSASTEANSVMAALEEDERPKKKIVHEIGQDLALLAVKELEERIALLKAEIERLEAAIAGKRTSRSVADQFFKR